MEKIDLSIIILSYNTKALIKKCLESIETSFVASLPKTEVIVVDNASIDGSVEMLRDLSFNHFKLTIIQNKQNLGFAKGNNVGLKKAEGEYILFLNSDTEIFTNALSDSLEGIKNDPLIGAITPKTMLPSGKMDPDCHRGFPTPWASITYFLGLEKLFPKSKIFGQYHQGYLNLNKDHLVDAGAGAFMLVSKKVIDQVGAWDESYFFYGEDLDFFYRIKKAGFKIMFLAKPLLKHLKGASSGLRKESQNISNNEKQNRIKVAKASVQAMEIFYKKFYQDVYPFWLAAFVLAAIRIKGFIRVAKHYLS